MSVSHIDESGVILPCAQCGKKNRIPYGRLKEAAQCGGCKASLTPPDEPIEVESEAAFERLIAHSALPVVVDFWAPWCGPCKMVAPEIVKVAHANPGRYIVVKVNTEALPTLGQRYRIQSIPTLSVFSGGRELKRDAGARPAPAIEAFVAGALNA